MKKYNILAAVFALSVLSAGAQQMQTTSVYEIQGLIYNPGMAGVQQHNTIGVTYRTQWSNVEGAPKTATVFGAFSLPEHKIGFSGNIYNDKTGPTSRTGISISVAKQVVMNDGSKLSLGIESRFQQFSIDRNKLSTILPGDPAIGSKENSFKYDAGFGIAYVKNRLELGVSVSQLVQSKLNYYEGSLNRTQEGRLYRHYYAHGRYRVNIDEATVLTPNFLFVYLPNAPGEYQVGATMEHSNIFWWGVGLRSKLDVMMTAGVRVHKKMSIGYCFDLYNTTLSDYQAGASSHEVMLKYDFIK
jgi:type IX secretion system PorP/SprF family membrane protein